MWRRNNKIANEKKKKKIYIIYKTFARTKTFISSSNTFFSFSIYHFSARFFAHGFGRRACVSVRTVYREQIDNDGECVIR